MNTLTQSQKEIMASEMAYPGSAVNTISIRLHLPDTDTIQTQAAVIAVLSESDIFSAELCRDDSEWCFLPRPQKGAHCEITEIKKISGAESYVKAQDTLPLLFPKELYQAQIIPLHEGGSIAYIRFHHIIIDGYGMCLFAQRVLDFLENTEIQKSIFLTHKRSEKELPNSNEIAFWKNYFDGFDSKSIVFTENSANTEKTVGRDIAAHISVGNIDAFAKQTGVTVPYVLLAAYALYLAESASSDETVILMPRLNRKPDEMNTIGCFTLLVPVKIKIEQNETFAQLCVKAMMAAKEASKYKGIGYGSILRTGKVSGSPSEYVFNYYRYRIKSNISYKLCISVAGAMHNHLTWNVFESDSGLEFSYDMKTDIYDESRIKSFSESIRTILTNGLENKALKDIPVIGENEKYILDEVKGLCTQLPCDETIPSLFKKAAQKYTDRPAVYFGEEKLTFTDLARMSDRIAAALIAKGIQNGDSVAFMLPRDIRLIPTILGILKSGAAFIPIDPDYPEDRIHYILDDSGAAYLISTYTFANSCGREYLEIDEMTAYSDSFTPPAICQTQTAYMIYTSGTTGRPKGVMISHRGIVNIVRPDNNPFNRDITENCRGIVAIGSICFDISLFEIFVPLMNGLFVELGNKKSMFDADELAIAVLRHGADILHCTPSRLAAYLDKPDFADAVHNIKAILSAGEVLPQSLVNELNKKYGIRIYNGYGPTEVTIGATITEAGDNQTSGKPIGNTGVFILNQHKKQIPYGAVGEICIYGDGVGIGYRGREEESRTKFIEWNGRRVYHTGDLGHIDRDGNIVYHGRTDRQIKLRGLRIELSEIERVMGTHPGVVQANCIVKKIGNTEHLAGFYTVDKKVTVITDELKTHLKKSLTAYMVPDILKELDIMPQAPGGKTDLRALAEIPVQPVNIYRAPENRTEELVCQAFAEVLEIDRVGLDDNFFELGGDSLRSVSLMLEIEKKLSLSDGKLEFSDIYRHPTPALIADRLSGTDIGQIGYDINSLDYTGFDALLSKDQVSPSSKSPLGNVLLTGVTGYLGIHILIELLHRTHICDHIFCLARANKRLTAEKRVRSTLFYYSEEDFSSSYGDRWSVIEGDITNPAIIPSSMDAHIDTIINSAANVAHFAYGDALTKINIDGVKNLIAFALKEGAELCQISTISVSGVYKNDNRKVFTEDDLFIGQEIYNEYIYTKYMAEYALLRASADNGLKFKVMRVGNLQGRSRDGEFQMNMKSNAFTRQLSSYVKMGAVPESVYRSSINFSPIDDTSHMIVSLAATPESHRIFHVYPPQEVAFEKIFTVLSEMGKCIRILPDVEFDAKLNHMKHTDDGKTLVEGLLIERPDGEFRYYPVTQESTKQMLEQLDEQWTPLSDRYLEKYLTALNELDMF